MTGFNHEVRAQVFDALNNAKENGAFDDGKGGTLRNMTPLEISEDLIECSDFPDPASDLVPYVEEWLRAHNTLKTGG